MSGFAIRVANASKSYQNGVPVLKNLSMTVNAGSIYGVYGASGCGKTTLLSCILGLKRLDFGYISVFGHDPMQTQELSRFLGFMPQEESLYELFKISEIFEYFGVLASLSSDRIKFRTEELSNLLKFPDKNRFIKDLSFGQKRRVSLGIALIGDTNLKLLILDEPTVGQDSLVKEGIWNHINELVAERKVTVLLTSHCTGEGRMCDKIGILRNGRLIAEDNPQKLLNFHQVPLFNDLLLSLCRKDSEEQQRLDIDVNICPLENVTTLPLTSFKRQSYSSLQKLHNMDIKLENLKPNKQKTELFNMKVPLKNFWEDMRTLYIVTKRNFILQIRQPLIICIFIMAPLLEAVLSVYVLGTDPKGMQLTVFNQETLHCSENSELLSCKLLQWTEKNGKINWDEALDFDSAKYAVTLGKSVGYVTIPANFTNHFLLRLALKQFSQMEEIEGTIVKLHLDNTNPIISGFITEKMLAGISYITLGVAKNFDVNPKEVEFPLKFNSIYDTTDASGWQDFFVSPIGPLIVFCLALGVAGMVHAEDKRNGTAARSFVAGLKTRYLFLSYYLSGTCAIILQTVVAYSTCLLLIEQGSYVKGSLWLILFLCLLEGWAGVGVGLFLGTLLANALEVLLTGLFISLTMLTSSGHTWDIACLPSFRRMLVEICNPLTLLISACRAVWNKGFGVDHPVVLRGLIIPLLFGFGFFFISILVHKMRRKD